eukprot:996902-Pelagomonas_calceolata.AAC.9
MQKGEGKDYDQEKGWHIAMMYLSSAYASVSAVAKLLTCIQQVPHDAKRRLRAACRSVQRLLANPVALKHTRKRGRAPGTFVFWPHQAPLTLSCQFAQQQKRKP